MVSQYYESSKYISNLLFIMPYTYILDDSIKSPTRFWQLITWLSYFSQFFFYKVKNFFFLLLVSLYMVTDTYLHYPPPFNGPFFMTPPFSAVSKSCDHPSVSTPSPPLLISDKSLMSQLTASQPLKLTASLLIANYCLAYSMISSKCIKQYTC